jgi:hypothetical protein
VTGAAPVLAMCRKLVEAGHDPSRPLHAYRGDTLCLKVRSIGEGAKLTVEHNRFGTPTLRRYRNGRQGDGGGAPIEPPTMNRPATADGPHLQPPDDLSIPAFLRRPQ